jgi:hypothetical protein
LRNRFKDKLKTDNLETEAKEDPFKWVRMRDVNRCISCKVTTKTAKDGGILKAEFVFLG